MIHGYDYRFVRAPNYSKRHGTWVKVPMIQEALKTHDTVVFLDADAVFMYPHLPFEWLMNMWNVTSETLMAISSDPDAKTNRDDKGLVSWNTGFIIAQQSKRTQELFDRWDKCPTEERYTGCKVNYSACTMMCSKLTLNNSAGLKTGLTSRQLWPITFDTTTTTLPTFE